MMYCESSKHLQAINQQFIYIEYNDTLLTVVRRRYVNCDSSSNIELNGYNEHPANCME